MIFLLCLAPCQCKTQQGASTSIFNNNDIDIEMVYIPPGTFMMGSATGTADEKPVHQVSIKAFYLSRTEITVNQWRFFVKESGYLTEAEKNGGGLIRWNNKLQIKKDASWQNPYLKQTENHPVVLISWNDAQAFCYWLSHKTGEYYCLPTEAEWEYACRAGSHEECYGNLDEISWYEYNSGGNTHPVATKKPNRFGLYDMLGNVWEWCQDYYGAHYYSESPVRNPTGPETGTERISRGGTWCSQPSRIRAAFRRHDSAHFRFYRLGFRVARK